MTPEEALVVAHLMRTLGNCVAERRSLITIATEAAIPYLESQLEKHRRSAQYQLVVRRYEVAAKQLEVDSTAEALAHLFAKLNEGKPEN